MSASAVVRPWEEQWQVWRPVRKSSVFTLEQSGELEALRISEEACVAIPARLVVVVPVWVEAADDDTAREIARLEIEMKGLASGERLMTDVEVAILKRQDGRVLVRGLIYPADWPGSLRALKGSRFLPSPLLVACGGDAAVHLWRELDDLVAVVVWKDQVVCWETTHWPAGQEEVASWLQCLMIQLDEELKFHEPFQLKEWFGVFSEVPETFRRDSSLGDDDREKGPAVKVEISSGNWLPAAMRELRLGKQKRLGLLRLAAAALALVVCLVAVFVVMNVRMSWRIQEADREIARLEAETAPLSAIAAQWTRVESSVDERFHPLEILREVVGAMPPEGLRLTVFQMSVDRVLIEGEAANVSAATEFFRAIQTDSKSELLWEMTPPALQPNNTARFAITGGRAANGK